MIYKFITDDKEEALEMEYSSELRDVINKTLSYIADNCEHRLGRSSDHIQSFQKIYDWIEELIQSKGFDISNKVELYIPDDEGC